MPPCMWCKQPIEDGARRCHHCRAWQREGADKEESRQAQILDRNIVYWGKFILGTLAIVGAVGLTMVGYDIRDASRQADAAQIGAQAAQLEVEASAARAEARAMQLDRLVDEGREKLAEALAGVENTGGAVRALEERVARLEAAHAGDPVPIEERVARLEAARAGRPTSDVAATVPPPLVAEELASVDVDLQVVQRATPVSDTGGTGARQSFDVTFSLCIRDGQACDDDRLRTVSRVVYRLDPRWFAVADIQVVRASDAFRYTVRVWGVTRVRACIFLVGAPDRPLSRAGPIRLSEEPTTWGPESSAATEECRDLIVQRPRPPPLP